MKPALLLGLIGAVLAALFYVLMSSPGDVPKGPNGPLDLTGTPSTEPATTRTDAREAAQAPNQKTPVASATQRAAVDSNQVLTGAWNNALEGLVVSTDGTPIAEANLELVAGVSGNEYSELEAATSAASGEPVKRWRESTDAMGRFRFTNLPPGESFRLRARHPDYSEAYKANFVMQETGVTTIELVLGKGFVLTGRVLVDATGEPLEGVRLKLATVMSVLPGADQSGTMEARTDDFGVYEFNNVPVGRYNLSLTHKGYGAVTRNNLPFAGDPTKQEPTIQMFRLQPGLTLRGRVVTEDGKPIPGARVAASSFGTAQTSSGSAITTKTGTFEITDLNEALFMVTANAQNYAETRLTQVAIGADAIEIELTRQGGVSGTVVSSVSGEPIPDFRANVRMMMPGTGGYGRTVTGNAFKDGVFQLEGLNAGRYVIEADADGFAPSYSTPFDVEFGQITPDVTVAMVTGASIKGRIVGVESGEPIGNVVIRTMDNGFRDNEFTKILGAQLPRSTTDRRVKTKADGEFELTALAAGSYQLELRHKDYTTNWIKDITVGENQMVDLSDIKLMQGATVSGIVYYLSGRPVPNARIHINGMVLYPGNPRTDDEGKFILRNVAAGHWNLSAQRNGNSNLPFDGLDDIMKSEVLITVREGEDLVQNLQVGM